MGSSNFVAVLRAQLSEFVTASFASGTSLDQIRQGVLSNPNLAGLDRGELLAALDDVLGGREELSPSPVSRPRLLVDWGELPQVGRSARPLFSLIWPDAQSRPSIRVTVDRGLDNDPADPLRQVRTEEEGFWTFYVPFSLTLNGLDVRPGLYVIDVDVSFSHVPEGQPRFLQTRIRLNLPDANSDRRELVIDGDGQSVVNLAGHDLRSFSRVVLKGDDKAIINLQNFGKEMAALPEKPAAPVVFEYELKVNRDIQERLPRVVAVPRPSKADAITLAVGDRRIHVIARKRVTFGRSRENDVCLRFLPRSAEHDEGSRSISRTHTALDLTDDGLVLNDEKSAKGIDVDCDPVKGDKTFTHLDAHGGRRIDLPSPLSTSLVLEMELTIFGLDPEDPAFRADLDWDDVCFDVAGEPASRLWQVARSSGIEAARLRRLNNLPDEEYVFLYRHATAGKSAKDHAISLPGLGPAATDLRLIYAGRMFWLHSGGRLPITVDGERVNGACLVPLAVGQVLGLGGATLAIGTYTQIELDDEGGSAGTATPGSLSNAATAARSPVAAPPPVPVPPPPPVVPMRAAVVPPKPPEPPPPPRASQRPQDSAFSSADPVRAALQSVAVITADDGHGSGFLAAPGILVTNYHVVAESVVENLRASFPDNRGVAGETFRLELVHEDPANDLAYLGINVDIPPLRSKHSFQHRNGHKIVAIGSPGVGAGGEKLENLTTDGRLGPEFADDTGGPTLWALSMAVNPGNSGGPVVDAETGEVLAVVVAKFTATDGHALAVPFEAFSSNLDVATASTEVNRGRATSLHRQRYCHRAISNIVSAADSAVQHLVTEISSMNSLGSDASHEFVNSFTAGFGRDLVATVESIRPNIDSELSQLRDDGLCPPDVRSRLERAWGGTQRLARQLAAEVGRLEVDVFADDIRMALDRSRTLLGNLQVDLLT